MNFKNFFAPKTVEVSLREDEEGNLYFTDKKTRYDLKKLPKNKIFHVNVLKLEGVDFSKINDLSNVYADQMFLNGTALTLAKMPKARTLYLMGIHDLTPFLAHLPEETKTLDIFDCSGENGLHFSSQNKLRSLSWNRGSLPDGFANALPDGLKELVIRDVSIVDLKGLNSKTNLETLTLTDIEELKGNVGAYLPSSLTDLLIENCADFKDLTGLSKETKLTRLKIVSCPNLSNKLPASFPLSLKEFETMQSSFENFKGIHPDVSLERFVFNRYFSSKKPSNLLEGLSRAQLDRLNFDWVPSTYRSSLKALRNKALYRLNRKENSKIRFCEFSLGQLMRGVRRILTR